MFNERKQIRPIIVVGLLLSVAFPVFSMLTGFMQYVMLKSSPKKPYINGSDSH